MSTYIKLSEQGRKLLIQVRDILVNRPETFDWSDFIDAEDKFLTTHSAKQVSECGTQCCIAGHICVLAFMDIDVPIIAARANITGMYWDDTAQFFLTGEHPNIPVTMTTIGRFLFYPWNWMDDNGDMLKHNDGYMYKTDAAVREAIARIDWVLADKDPERYVIVERSLIQPLE